MTRLDDIIKPSAYGFDKYDECPECMFNFKDAKYEIKKLVLELANTCVRNYDDDNARIKLEELRQKIQEL